MNRESKIQRIDTELPELELEDGSVVSVKFVRVVGLQLHIMTLTNDPVDYDVISDEPDHTTLVVDGVSASDLPLFYVESVLDAINKLLPDLTITLNREEL